MGELIALLIILGVILFGAATGIVVLGAMGSYLSFPVLGVLTVLVIAWPILSYRRQIKNKQWVGSFWSEESGTIVLISIGLAIIWGCALKDQLSALWDSISPFILR
jgi:hypothetical protein